MTIGRGMALGRWTDWAKIVLGLVAIAVPELLGGKWPTIGFEDTAGIALAACGVWAVLRPNARPAQWLALAASAMLVLWPAGMDPDELTAPWVGIVAGFLGAVATLMSLRAIPPRPRPSHAAR